MKNDHPSTMQSILIAALLLFLLFASSLIPGEDTDARKIPDVTPHGVNGTLPKEKHEATH